MKFLSLLPGFEVLCAVLDADRYETSSAIFLAEDKDGRPRVYDISCDGYAIPADEADNFVTVLGPGEFHDATCRRFVEEWRKARARS